MILDVIKYGTFCLTFKRFNSDLLDEDWVWWKWLFYMTGNLKVLIVFCFINYFITHAQLSVLFLNYYCYCRSPLD